MRQLSRNAKKILLWGAISFLLLGIFTGIPTVVWGHQALSKNNRHTYTEVDRKIIVGGMVLGYLGVALSVFILYLFLVAYAGWTAAIFFAPTAI